MESRKRDQILGPVARPQDQPSNLPFYRDAVRRNLGITGQNSPHTSPFQDPVLNAKILPKVFNFDNKMCRTPVWIDDTQGVNALLAQSESATELAIDFENNTEHSYLGKKYILS